MFFRPRKIPNPRPQFKARSKRLAAAEFVLFQLGTVQRGLACCSIPRHSQTNDLQGLLDRQPPVSRQTVTQILAFPSSIAK